MIVDAILAHSDSKKVSTIRAWNKASSPKTVLLLTRSFLKVSEWRSLCSEKDILPIHDYLAELAPLFKQKYLDFLLSMAKEKQGPEWWANRLSERNTLIQHLFLHCLYLQIAKKVCLQKSGAILIVCENIAVLKILTDFLQKNNVRVQSTYPFFLPFKQKIRANLRAFAYVFRFILRWGEAGFGYRNKIKKISSTKSLLIHTYIDDHSLKSDSDFFDRYFPGLNGWLKNKDIKPYIIPELYNTQKGRRKAWQRLRKYKNICFINPYSQFSIRDVIAGIFLAHRSTILPKVSFVIDGEDYHALFFEENRNQKYSTIDQLMYLFLPSYLRKAGIEFDILLQEFENMVTEKMLTIAFKKIYPSIQVLGFQHFALLPLFLCASFGKGEAQVAPLPDLILCNGPLYRDILQKDGIESERLKVVPALRYQYLYKKKEHAEQLPAKAILVNLPLMIDDSAELFLKVMAAFKNEIKIRLMIKPHPMANWKNLLETVGIKELPPHFTLVTGLMEEYLNDIAVVISLSSSSILELVAAGIYAINVGKESALAFNPLAYYDGFEKIYYKAEDIRERAFELLASTEKEKLEYKEKSNFILQQSFMPYSEKGMLSFLGLN